MGRFDNLVEAIKSIDVDSVNNWSVKNEPEMKIVEQQKVYFWIRVFLKEKDDTIQTGDNITIKYTPSGETLTTQFIYYAKQGLMKDHDEQIVNYTGEEDKKVLCLMIDEGIINSSNEIPFIRTLFKSGRFYEEQVYRRSELLLINERTGKNLDYFDCDF
jgi:hypothetical protein